MNIGECTLLRVLSPMTINLEFTCTSYGIGHDHEMYDYVGIFGGAFGLSAALLMLKLAMFNSDRRIHRLFRPRR